MAYRRVEVTVPKEYSEEAEEAMNAKLKDFNPRHPQHLMISTGDDDVVYSVNLHPPQVGEYLHSLEKQVGIGVKYGLATILEAAACKPAPPHPLSLEERLKNNPGKHGKHPTWMQKYGQGRMSVEEIHTAIEGGNSLDFNFWCFLIGAAIIAGGGLATNSAVMVVASMLVSPLMGPILAVTFGVTTRDWKLMRSGMANELIASFVTLLFGFILGLVLTPLGERLSWPTSEMAGRGNSANFIVGVIFAIASGVIVGVAVTGGGINSLVGVAISASLLPPIVNCGMLLAFALLGPSEFAEFDASTTTSGTCHQQQQLFQTCAFSALEDSNGDNLFAKTNTNLKKYGVDADLLLEQALWSIALYLMNVVVIGFVCTCTFHLKHLVPDPFDKMGHQWAAPENHRKAVAAKNDHVKQTHAAALAAQTAGTNGSSAATKQTNPLSVSK
jgi:uncharacterized hydrophobic protein (TIGR00271 family)